MYEKMRALCALYTKTCTNTLSARRRELEHVFGGSEYGYMDDMLVIPTCQHARHDLVQMGDEIEAEKDRLLNVVRRSSHS
jgi:hypothetical protein